MREGGLEPQVCLVQPLPVEFLALSVQSPRSQDATYFGLGAHVECCTSRLSFVRLGRGNWLVLHRSTHLIAGVTAGS